MPDVTPCSAETPASFSGTLETSTNQKLFGLLQVPIYQRLFVWGEKEIGLLLDDLYYAYKKDADAPYYIGIFTFVKTAQSEKWDIVDGQQRLTCLTLLGAYIHNKNWENFVFLNKDEELLRIHYFGRSEDMEDIRRIWNNSLYEVKNPHFRTFIDCISRKQKELGTDWGGYCDYIYQYASFLISILPGEYGPIELNRFFEKMNAAGRQLTPIEQIKSKYFSQHAAIFDACLNFEKAYEEPQNQNSGSNVSSKQTLEDILNSSIQVEPEPPENNSIDRYVNHSILRPAIFLLHVLTITSKQSIPLNENRLLETFDETFDRNRDFLGRFIDEMRKYRRWLDENIIFIKYSDRDSFEYAFRSDENDKDEDCEQEKLRQFQSMLYVSSSDNQQWVLGVYREENGNTVSLKSLKQRDENGHELPDLNSMKYNSIDRYWFWKLDYILWERYLENQNDELFSDLTSEEKDAIKKYRFKSNRSIEHLHPQTDTNSSVQWEEDDKDCFGNLAMISSSFNSAQQNDTIGVKFARLRDTQIPHKTLESIKMLLMFAAAKKQESGWTQKKAREHGKTMHDLIKECHSNSDTTNR